MIWIFSLIPVLLEAGFDKIAWQMGKNDKPWSTLFRFVLFAMIAIGDPSAMWWQSLFMAFAVHFLLFDYVINLVRGQKWYYVSKSNHWYERFRRAFKWEIAELGFKLWLTAVAWGVYAHLDWIR